jgi:hypothetical protein
VKDEIHVAIDVDVPSDVVSDEFEVAIAKMRDVGDVTSAQIIDTDDVMTAIEEGLAEMGSDEARRAGDDDSH